MTPGPSRIIHFLHSLPLLVPGSLRSVLRLLMACAYFLAIQTRSTKSCSGRKHYRHRNVKKSLKSSRITGDECNRIQCGVLFDTCDTLTHLANMLCYQYELIAFISNARQGKGTLCNNLILT